MIPIAAGLLAGAAVSGGAYNVAKALENKRYWDNYYARTGVRAKYPFRSGYYDTWKYFNSAATSFGFAGSHYASVTNLRHYRYYR